MSAARLKLELDPGATFRFGLRPAVDTEDGRVYDDLTGSTFTFVVHDDQRQIRTDYSDGVTVEDGIIYVELTPEQTKQFLPHRRYYFALDQEEPSGDVRRLLAGPLYAMTGGA